MLQNVGFASDDNVVEALDNLNETTLNIFKNTYVRDVTFSADTAGGAVNCHSYIDCNRKCKLV